MWKMNRQQQVKEYLYHIMLLVFVLLICMVSLTEISLFGVLNVRELGILAFGFVDLLFLIRLFCEKEIPVKKRMISFIYVCMMTVVYMMYCKDFFFATIPGTTDDALYTAGILVILFVFACKDKALS